jgi:hypothetical protein
MTEQQIEKKHHHEISIDKMRVQENKLSSSLVLISLILSLIALFTMINFDQFIDDGVNIRVVPNMRIGIEIAIAITLMLLTFMASEKVKYYDAFWSRYGLFILAGINFLRIFNIPFYIFGKYDETMVPMITAQSFYFVIVEFFISALLLTFAGGIALKRVTLLQKHLKEIKAHGHNAV